MDEEKDRYLENLYGSEKIVLAAEGEPLDVPPGMPAYLKVEFEEVKEAEEWFGIEQDLGLVIEAAGRAAEIAERGTSPGEGRPDAGEADIVEHSLWTTALIAYARCFGTGVRARLDKGIFGEQEEMIRMHDYYKNIRDKHLAHSVNPFEVTATGIAVLDPHGEEPYVFNATSMHATRSTEHSTTMRYLADLAGWLQHHVRQKRQEALQKVLRRGKELTKEQIRELPPLEVKPMQGYDAARLPRPPRL